MSIQQLLEEVLTITDYPEKDRQSMSNQLQVFAIQGAILAYAGELSEEKRDELKKQFEGKSPEEVIEACKIYFAEESFKKYFAQEIDRVIADYIEEFAPEFTAEQQKKLEELFEKLPHSDEE